MRLSKQDFLSPETDKATIAMDVVVQLSRLVMLLALAYVGYVIVASR